MELNLRSLAYFTDISILGFSGLLADRGDYLVAESPKNPWFYWGNLLVMKHAPESGDFDRWVETFRNEFAHVPEVRHMTFGWDSPEGEEGDIGPFLSAGFKVERSVVLTLKRNQFKKPAHFNDSVEVRPLRDDRDWESATLNQVATREPGFSYEEYFPFKDTQMKNYRCMTESGHGFWFGAFLNDQLVGDCGVIRFGETGRFQSVTTRTDFRRQGVCSTLVAQSAIAMFDRGAQTLVMVADPEYHAARIYESVGFRPTEKQIGVCRYPEKT